MKNSSLNELSILKIITGVSDYSLSNKLDFIKDAKKAKIVRQELQKVETYRFTYKVNKLNVVGYVAIPRGSKGKIPCIIHLRGGSREFAALTPRDIYGKLVRFALEGYVVIATQYPGVDGGSGLDTFGGVNDIASITKLKDILRGISIADTDNIGVKGHSRGGLMAYMLLREVKWIKAAVIAAAPTDQIRQGKERPKWREHQISLWGKGREELTRRSPLKWVDKLSKKVPILLMHGSADWRVSPVDSLEMSQLMLKNSIPHRFILFEGADHGITEFKTEYLKQSLDWFNRFLKKQRGITQSKTPR